ncbi:hypothetical protein DM860_010111 [Cuscuta australis]|uniref:Uncharacterized protein n=1 Tax=Cuscuta australis TaxID=267555 RepID=A0A328D682_9ASTE|nr:hypothetical protein DM860_010111 [Cuscuta australis]
MASERKENGKVIPEKGNSRLTVPSTGALILSLGSMECNNSSAGSAYNLFDEMPLNVYADLGVIADKCAFPCSDGDDNVDKLVYKDTPHGYLVKY